MVVAVVVVGVGQFVFLDRSMGPKYKTGATLISACFAGKGLRSHSYRGPGGDRWGSHGDLMGTHGDLACTGARLRLIDTPARDPQG